MKISFIIPVYNCCQHLNNCLQKIRDVKLLNYEIILENKLSQIEINVDKQYVVDFVYNRYLALTK